ncbi:MAG: SLC13 family permease [Oscillospiraceae bacterium]
MTQSKYSTSYLVKIGVTVLIPVLIMLIPLSDVFTSNIRIFFAITVFGLLSLAFELLPMMMVSCLLPASYLFLGLAEAGRIFGMWTTVNPLMLVGAFLLANILDEIGLLKRIAYWLAIRCGGSYAGIIVVSILVGVISRFLGSAVVGAVFCYGICKSLNLKGRPAAAGIMLSGAVACGTAAFFIYTPMDMSIILGYLQGIDPEFTITYSSFLLQNLPAVLFLVAYGFLAYKMFKDDGGISGKAYFQEEYAKLGKMKRNEKIAGVLTILLVIFLFTTSLHHIDAAWGFIVIPWLMFLPGVNIDAPNAIKNINIHVIFFAVCCIAIGNVAMAVGVGDLISATVVPIFEALQNVGNYLVYLVTWIFGFLLNFILTPMAMLGVGTMPVAEIAANLGIGVKGMLYLFYLTTDAIVMPYESMVYVIPFAFGMIKMKDFIKFGAVRVIIALLIALFIMVPYWTLIGIL